MKTIQKFITIGLCLALLCSTNICALADDSTESAYAQAATAAYDKADIEYYEELMLLQANAAAANEELEQAYGHDEYGNTTYPDDFAGTWIDGEYLYIALTDVNNASVEKYTNWAGEYADYVCFERAEYSYNYLKEQADAIALPLLEDETSNISGYYVSQKDNEIVINTYNNESTTSAEVQNLDALTQIVESSALPLKIEYMEPSNTTATNLSGGAQLCNSNRGISFSLGCFGTYKGNTTIVTCGHGSTTQYVGDTIRYKSSSGSIIGTIQYNQYANYQNGDYEFISVDETLFNPKTTISSYSITGSLTNPAVGTVVKWYGYATGYVSYGSVIETNQTVVANEDSITACVLNGMTRVQVTYGTSIAGDSGCPFFQSASSGSGVNFCGVMHGSQSNAEYVVFTPYKYLVSAGFIAMTS